MFEIAPEVLRWHSVNEAGVVARVVSVNGLSTRWPAQAIAAADRHGTVGAILASVADPQLLPVIANALSQGQARGGGNGRALGSPAQVVEVIVPDRQAKAAGLACGGSARVLVQPTTEVPDVAWQVLADREPICLVTDLSGPEVGHTSWFTLDSLASGHDDHVGAGAARHTEEMVRLFGRGRSTTAVGALVNGSEALVDVLWPTPRLLVVGEGVIADALRALAQYLEWSVAVSNDREQCVRELTSLTRADATVVLSHDLELAGPALEAALGGGAGYVGALGARRTQTARAHWLQDNGVVPSQVARIRGPAGLDLGARTPQETALSIVAEILAARAGSNGQPLRDRPGPVHLNGLHAEPPPQDDSPLRRPPT